MVPAQQLACLRAASPQTLLDGWDALGTPTSAVNGTPTLPLDPRAAVAQGKVRHVPLLIGSNRDEGRYFSVDQVGQDEAGYDAWLQNNLSGCPICGPASTPGRPSPPRLTPLNANCPGR